MTIYARQSAGRAHARREIFQYIELYYNNQRFHSALDYQSPQQYEAAYQAKKKTCTFLLEKVTATLSATVHEDWVIVFQCNGKNRFGAYVGLQRVAIMWKDGAIDMEATNNFQQWQSFREGLREYYQ